MSFLSELFGDSRAVITVVNHQPLPEDNSNQHLLFQPLLDFCHQSHNITLHDICEYIVVSYIPYLVAEIKTDLTLSRQQQEDLLNNNLQAAIHAAAAVLDQRFPADQLWINLLTTALSHLTPHVVKLCLSVATDPDNHINKYLRTEVGHYQQLVVDYRLVSEVVVVVILLMLIVIILSLAASVF